MFAAERETKATSLADQNGYEAGTKVIDLYIAQLTNRHHTLSPLSTPSIAYIGWTLTEYEVWRGFLVTIAWFIFLLCVAGIGLRLRK